MKFEDFVWPNDPSPIPEEWLWGRIRAWRNTELALTDWTQLADAPVDAKAWAVYRQELRDITDAPTPQDIVFPTQPLIEVI